MTKETLVVGAKARLQNLAKKSLNGIKVKVTKLNKDGGAIVMVLDGSKTKYEVELQNLKALKPKGEVLKTAPEVDDDDEVETLVVEEAPAVEIDETDEEDTDEGIAVNKFYRLQNCKNEDLNKKLVVVIEVLEDGKFRVEDKDGGTYKVTEAKLKPSIRTFPRPDFDEGVELEELPEELPPTIDELIDGGHSTFVLQNCKNEDNNGKLVTFVERVVEEGKIRLIGEDGTKYKVTTDKLVPVEVEADEESAVETSSAFENLEAVAGDEAAHNIERFEKYMLLIAGIPYIELEEIISAYKSGRLQIEAATEVESTETDEESFRRLAPEIGLDPDLFGAVIVAPFSTGAREFIITRINPNAKMSPVEAVDANGNRFWFQVVYINKCIEEAAAAEKPMAIPTPEVHQA